MSGLQLQLWSLLYLPRPSKKASKGRPRSKCVLTHAVGNGRFSNKNHKSLGKGSQGYWALLGLIRKTWLLLPRLEWLARIPSPKYCQYSPWRYIPLKGALKVPRLSWLIRKRKSQGTRQRAGSLSGGPRNAAGECAPWQHFLQGI